MDANQHTNPISDQDFLGEEFVLAIANVRFIDTKILMGLAAGLGWHWQVHKAFHFTSQDGMSIDIPSNSALNAKVFRNKVNTLVRHRAPDANVFTVVESIIAFDRWKVDPDRARVLREAVAAAPPVEPAPTATGGNQESEPVPAKARRKVRIIREEPWAAHRRPSGETYPSDAVMERTWSNDTVDYRCRWDEDLSDRSKGCDFTDDSPQTVARHNAAHKRGQGRTPQAEIDGVDPAHVANPRRTTRIRNLTREIDGAFQAAMSQGMALDPEWLAQWIIDHRIDSLPSDTVVSNEPLSAEEILDRIAALVDRGRGKILREQVDTLQVQVDNYQAERDTVQAAMQAQLDAANARADKVEGDWNAIKDMLVMNAPKAEGDTMPKGGS